MSAINLTSINLLILLVVFNLVNTCKELWFNECENNEHCCSGFCDKLETWVHGVCKVRSMFKQTFLILINNLHNVVLQENVIQITLTNVKLTWNVAQNFVIEVQIRIGSLVFAKI